MKFSVINSAGDSWLREYFYPVIKSIEENGDIKVDLSEDPDFILNFIDINKPKSVNRTRDDQKLISITTIDKHINEVRKTCFSTLVRSLSNMLFCVPGIHRSTGEASYTTPEGGYVTFRFSGANFLNAIKPITHSHFVFRNRLEIRKGIPLENIKKAEEQLSEHSRKLDQLGIVPTPFSLKDYLSPHQIEMLYRLYRMKGLSYGNMSVRNETGERDKTAFWMSVRGVDKSKINEFGKDFMLVDGYDEEAGEMVVGVPEEHDPTCRVSVDAIEHYMIYKAHPEVGAIVHVHAWIDGVKATKQNYPCGSYELALSVSDMVRQSADPGEAIIGLKNHGLTVTGPDLDNIFKRISGVIKTEVPMIL